MAGGDAASGAAAAAAYEPIVWRRRKPWARRVIVWLFVIVVLGAAAWVISTNNTVAAQIKDALTTPHVETITDGSIAIKPRGFASYRVTVPEGAIDVAVVGQFDVSARVQNDIEVFLLTDAELVTWQSGYAISPYYDSGRVSQGNVQAPLPSRSATYYLVFSNKPSTVEKTVHLTVGLHYDTWLPDGVVYLKQKIQAWFE